MAVLIAQKLDTEHTALVTAGPSHCLVLNLTEKIIFFATETADFWG